MNYDLWTDSFYHETSWTKAKIWFGNKWIRKAIYLLILASIYLSVSVRLSDQQISFVSAYVEAQIALFVGLDPAGTVSLSFPEGPLDISRIGASEIAPTIAAWTQFLDAAKRGFLFAMTIIFLPIGWYVGNRIIYKQALKREVVEAEIQRKRNAAIAAAAISKAHSVSVPLPPQEPVVLDVEIDPPVAPASQAEKTVEPADHIDAEPAPEPPIAEPQHAPKVLPLRQPGRIYRDDN